MQNVSTPSHRPMQYWAGITVRRAYGVAGERGWKKRMPFYNRTDTGFNVTRCESMLTSNRCLIAREPGEPLEMGTQKTALSAGALIDDTKKWNSIDWSYTRRQVRRLQVRIAKAVKEKRRLLRW